MMTLKSGGNTIQATTAFFFVENNMFFKKLLTWHVDSILLFPFHNFTTRNVLEAFEVQLEAYRHGHPYLLHLNIYSVDRGGNHCLHFRTRNHAQTSASGDSLPDGVLGP